MIVFFVAQMKSNSNDQSLSNSGRKYKPMSTGDTMMVASKDSDRCLITVQEAEKLIGSFDERAQDVLKCITFNEIMIAAYSGGDHVLFPNPGFSVKHLARKCPDLFHPEEFVDTENELLFVEETSPRWCMIHTSPIPESETKQFMEQQFMPNSLLKLPSLQEVLLGMTLLFRKIGWRLPYRTYVRTRDVNRDGVRYVVGFQGNRFSISLFPDSSVSPHLTIVPAQNPIK